jgi:hypothetical protein
MGYIKEPKDVDFVIQSKPLTDEERKEISKYIAAYKKRNKKIASSRSKTRQQA